MWLLSVLEVLGFVALCTSAVLASLVLSVARSLLVLALRIISNIYQTITRLTRKTISVVTKADTRWIVIRIGRFSILLGKKNASTTDGSTAKENH